MRRLKYLLAAAGLLAASAWGYAEMLQLTGNIHTVIPGELYRSAQINSTEIRRLEAKDAIRSILNLRGPDPGQPWYDAEVKTSQDLGITHADFAMKSTRELSKDQIGQLVALMRSLPKPLLIHCEHGADRTGLAAALYLGAITGEGEEEAEEQLSPRFGHFALPYVPGPYAMDETWEVEESLLGYKS